MFLFGLLNNHLINPASSDNDFIASFRQSILTHRYRPSTISYRPFLDEIEFYLPRDDNKQTTKIIFSSKSNLENQFSYLQYFLTIFNQQNKYPTVINLSSSHPYATFSSN